MFDIRSLNNHLYLAEPNALRRIIAQVAAVPTCPNPRELAETRRQRCEIAKNAAGQAIRATKGKVGVIPIYGPVDQRYTAGLEKSGGTSLEEVGLAFNALMADPSVATIVFDIDSPGGSTYGTMELADKIFASRGSKQTIAVANSMAASAAYWIASAASTFVVTPGGDVGSIGVYCVHVDESKANEKDGFTVTAISAGTYKTEAAPWSPLSEEARANLQDSVNATYSKFLSSVARNRGVKVSEVKSEYGQGRLLNADQAKAAGMVDKIATLDEVLGQLTGRVSNGNKASMDVLRARHEHLKRKAAVHG